MTVLRRPFERARRLARTLLWEYGVDEPSKVDPFVIVGRHKIKVTYGRLDGASARIFRNGDRAIIRVSDQIVQLGRLRFTIAHEVAHYLLGHRLPTELIVGPDAPPPFSTHQERECDVFATEYLLHEPWVAPLCARVPITFHAVHAIEQTFRTSVVASAVRFVELADTAAAVVYSEHGRVVWARRSRKFPGRIPSQLRLGAQTAAAEHHERGILDGSPRPVPASSWFGTQSHQQIDGSLIEESEHVPAPGWGGVLSLLGTNDRQEDDLQRGKQ